VSHWSAPSLASISEPGSIRAISGHAAQTEEQKMPPSPLSPVPVRAPRKARTGRPGPARRTADPGGAPEGTDVPSPWRNRITGHGEIDPRELMANPSNWRTHPADQQHALTGALSEVGWVAGVLVNRTTGHLVDGHLRVELAIARGEPSIPVAYVELTPEEEDLVLASLDPIGAMASVERAALAELLARTETADADLQALLTELADRNGIRSLLADPDELPELAEPDDVYVRSGDLWALGDHRLLCGDATDPDIVGRLLGDGAPRLLVTDPPYGVSLDQTWRDTALGTPDTATSAKPRRTAGHRNTTMNGDARIDWSEAYTLVPSLEVGYVWHAGVHAPTVAAGLERIGFEIVSQIIWDKGLFALGHSWYHWAHEPCWVVRKPGIAQTFRGPRDQGTVWRVPSPKMVMAGSDEPKIDHPTQKPVALYEAPIRNHLAPGEALYDPFAGSGTAFIAAEALGRRTFGAEVDPRYCQLILERWQTLTGETAERIDD
jgi:DNA modification methylase